MRTRLAGPRRKVVAAVVATLALGGLAACSEPVPELRPVEVDEPVPVVTDGQLDRVLEQVTSTLAAADAANDPAALAARVDGAALQRRTAQYAIRAAMPKHPAPPAIGAERLADIVPTDGEWPRYVLTVTEPAPDAVPVMSVLTQAGPRAPYKLTASATLLPGVTLPRTISAETGVQELPPAEASDLLLPPVDALARYADVLAKGAASDFATQFADDAFRAAVVGEQDAERKAAGTTCPGCFSYAVTHTPRADAVWAVRTDDGGALVMGVLDSIRTFTVAAAGAKLPISADLAVLAGKDQATKSAAITSVEVVVMHVPPVGSDQPVTVLAADRGPLSVAAT